MIAENSDVGRKTLIDAGVLTVLLHLTTSSTVNLVVGGCDIVKCLMHSGVYRQKIITAGLREAMERITRCVLVSACVLLIQNNTSIFHKSSLRSKADRKDAQEAAKAVLLTFKKTKDLPHHSRSTSESSPRARPIAPVNEVNLRPTDAEETPQRIHVSI